MIPKSLAKEHSASSESFGMLAIRMLTDWHSDDGYARPTHVHASPVN